jgi:uncharacterized damage-inducible protein DinB
VRDREAFVAEVDHEMAATRRVLERVPDDALDWKPHDRSFSIGGLASHLAELPHWGRQILDADFYDLATAPKRVAVEAARAVVLETFDRHLGDVRRALAARSDAELAAPWTLRRAGHALLWMPRIAALRRFFLHHAIHHRGQMTVYLRLRDVAVPPLYGPTADERM